MKQYTSTIALTYLNGEKLYNVYAPDCGLALVLPSLLQDSQRKAQHSVQDQSASIPT